MLELMSLILVLTDNFNVANQNSKQNFFTNYSVQGRAHPRSYMYQMKRTGVLYSFIGIDASLEPGMKMLDDKMNVCFVSMNNTDL